MTASAAAGVAASMACRRRFCVRLSDFYGMTVLSRYFLSEYQSLLLYFPAAFPLLLDFLADPVYIELSCLHDE